MSENKRFVFFHLSCVLWFEALKSSWIGLLTPRGRKNKPHQLWNPGRRAAVPFPIKRQIVFQRRVGSRIRIRVPKRLLAENAWSFKAEERTMSKLEMATEHRSHYASFG
ncbi:hypothetical protein IWZ01DRAFT_26611 [Phyllosticta capitalensis]